MLIDMAGYGWQTVKPPISSTALSSLWSYVEGDVFCGSRRMAVEDVVLTFSEDVLSAIPGLAKGPMITIRNALRELKQSLAAKSGSVGSGSGSGGGSGSGSGSGSGGGSGSAESVSPVRAGSGGGSFAGMTPSSVTASPSAGGRFAPSPNSSVRSLVPPPL